MTKKSTYVSVMTIAEVARSRAGAFPPVRTGSWDRWSEGLLKNSRNCGFVPDLGWDEKPKDAVGEVEIKLPKYGAHPGGRLDVRSVPLEISEIERAVPPDHLG
jgi:hypothetical protein